MTRARGTVLLLGIATILAVVAVAVTRAAAGEIPDIDRAIADEASDVGEGREIHLTSVVPSQWDRVHVFPPYSGVEHVRAGLGFDWSPLSPVESMLGPDLLLASDELSLLVFVRGEEEVIAWAIVNSREEPPYVYLAHRSSQSSPGLTRDEARFRVEAGDRSRWPEGSWALTPVR